MRRGGDALFYFMFSKTMDTMDNYGFPALVNNII